MTHAAGIDQERIRAAVRELLLAIGEDPDREELAATPDRVAQSYVEFFAGVGVDPAELLSEAVPVGDDTGELVLMRDITLRSVCEHHLLPFRGRVHIAYRPHARVVGLGALPRVVEVLAARPQLQERLGEQIAETVDAALAPHGVLVVIEAQHGCVTDRGVRQADSSAVTIASRGVYVDAVERAEVMALISMGDRSTDRAGESAGATR
ncbi:MULTISPECIES: GTP cyclohydrolase I FolE [unclassified Leucobacter]|uniref:GTP cyclohydrolase I FolE n=1 Tax=unclassified Leucobacter TaxID=2621730 RepID=UPI001F140426|nr:GTP cyclohydrolase I FolE [Leucobacter sp. CX169]